MPRAFTGKTEGNSTARGKNHLEPQLGLSDGTLGVARCSMCLLELPHSLLAGFQNKTFQDYQVKAMLLFVILSWNSHSITFTIIA